MQSVARAALSTSTGESPAQVRRTEERAREDREHTERRRSADEWRARGVETRGGDPRLRSDDLFFSDRDRARIAAIPLDQYPENVRVNIERIRNQPTGLENRTEGDDGLLPGFSRRLEPGQTLEGTVERLATVIPRGLRRRLPATPPDHEDILLEDRLIRVNRHSREIVDTVPVGPGRAVLRGS
ncbi:MAG: hypothetical protein JJU00_19510 [Opitutales bacterium]|nr:hypothetical protein [Opitutales bacterium]